MTRQLRLWLALSAVAISTPLLTVGPSSAATGAGHRVGLGKIVSTSDGGQVFGWDINMNGTDGVLASAQPGPPPDQYQVSVQTFDQVTGKITHTFAEETGRRNSYAAQGIFANDIALVTHYVVPRGTIYAKRRYDLMDPVTRGAFTGTWKPPVKNFDVQQNGINQDTTTSVLFGIDLDHGSAPGLVVSDIAAGTSKIIRLDPNVYGLGNAPHVAQDAKHNFAVMATDPDGGAVGGGPPINALIKLSTGRTTTWAGLNNGPFGAGYVNGLAVDPRTRIACTTTELNAQVEFYDLKERTKRWFVQLPGTGPADQLNSGGVIANDPVHKLFLVTDANFAPTGDSAVVVYNEDGTLVESITGFDFNFPTRIAVNPDLRMGWVDGPGIDQIQQFFY